MYTSSLPILKPVVQSEIFSNMWALVVEIMVITTLQHLRRLEQYENMLETISYRTRCKFKTHYASTKNYGKYLI